MRAYHSIWTAAISGCVASNSPSSTRFSRHACAGSSIAMGSLSWNVALPTVSEPTTTWRKKYSVSPSSAPV